MEVAAKTGTRSATSSATAKKRKVNVDSKSAVELRSSYAELKKQRRDDVFVSGSAAKIAAESERSRNDDVLSSPSDDRVEESSCCSSNGSSELVEEPSVKFADLEAESDQFESATYNSGRERREMTAPTREVQVGNTDEVQSNNNAESQPPVVNTTHFSAALEEFFSAAEQDNHKRFLEKYNYDIVKDEPVEGRWEWTRLKP